MTGTVHFDNFKVSKILFNPMETVLMTPNYKGLIRGEGGQGDISLRTYVYDMNDAFNKLCNYRYILQLLRFAK